MCRWEPICDYPPPGPGAKSWSRIQGGEFEFLNVRRQLGWPPAWNTADATKLWLYNLHYFDWLWVLEYAEAKRAVLHWIEQCPLTRSPVAWEPYPISLRVMNWCGFFWQKHWDQLGRDAEFQKRLWHYLYQQMEWLKGHLEYHLLGNHLLENAAALAFVGCCFEGADAARWFEQGESILREELPEQILPDGMHFERSPMYHSRVIFLLLLLAATGNRKLRNLVQPHLSPAIDALDRTCHPDGNIALLNDSAFGIFNQPAHLREQANALGVCPQNGGHAEAWSLPDA